MRSLDRRSDSRGGGRSSALQNDDRGVSETVGFVLVFALIATTIAVTFTVGLGGLEDARLAERDNNVERAFDVLHDNFNDLSRDGVPSRATEVRLAGGELRQEPGSEFRLSGDASGFPVDASGSVVYRGAGDTRIVYENGAVFRMQGDDGVMIAEPDLLVGDTVVYSLYDLGNTTRSERGDRTVLVVAEEEGRGVPVDNRTATGNITLDINSTQASAWRRYYENVDDPQDRISVDPDPASGADLRVMFDAERFVVHETETRIDFTD